jgi:hypothetical protein
MRTPFGVLASPFCKGIHPEGFFLKERREGFCLPSSFFVFSYYGHQEKQEKDKKDVEYRLFQKIAQYTQQTD